ncbi:probable ATP-dependent RNA helicase DDX52 [Sinocyclocheilus grahami]|uniref:probable ATP-dependent RNA helicase DDX52 n=1 Tax=Sinocyclocheilus grahami TaxID=75366 RepID=UPI0007AD418A|nr:PREDICTED: probable ATP-dependent RNA helicase DDX52 [Sinocyclocheilus grahami]
MDAFDLFRKLGSGAKFDLKRFAKDAERFKVVKSQSNDSSNQLAGVSFFGKETQENTSLESRLSEDDGDEEKEGSDEEQASGKRIKMDEPVKTARKKKKGAKKKSEDAEPEKSEGEGIQWMSSSQDKVKDPKKESKNKPSLKRLKQLHQEKVNRIRHQNRINVHGTDIPDPVSTFEELQQEYDLDPRIIQNIKAAGFQTPTPIQMQAVPLMMHKREILASAPTGSGKTMAFCLPLLAHLRQPLNKGFRALIISPTRELATQTHRELLKLSEGVGFRVHMINKGVEAVKKYGPKTAKKFDILVTTPNRLIYLLNQDPPAINLSSVEWLRDNVVSSFRSGKIWVLICTALLARGIDFKGINLVINYDFPTTAVEYIHRIGRTGRAGNKGKAITFFTEDDKPLLRSIATVIKKAGCPVPDYMIGLKKIKSKLKRQLVTKPPRRSTIRTTPRILFEKKPGKRKRKKRKAAAKEAKGEASEVISNS